MDTSQEINTDKPDSKELIRAWIKIGKGNPWIRYACDPPFNENSFCECLSIDELERLDTGIGVRAHGILP